eukprot:7207666-Prymnesium_polylepis.1
MLLSRLAALLSLLCGAEALVSAPHSWVRRLEGQPQMMAARRGGSANRRGSSHQKHALQKRAAAREEEERALRVEAESRVSEQASRRAQLRVLVGSGQRREACLALQQMGRAPGAASQPGTRPLATLPLAAPVRVCAHCTPRDPRGRRRPAARSGGVRGGSRCVHGGARAAPARAEAGGAATHAPGVALAARRRGVRRVGRRGGLAVRNASLVGGGA